MSSLFRGFSEKTADLLTPTYFFPKFCKCLKNKGFLLQSWLCPYIYRPKLSTRDL